MLQVGSLLLGCALSLHLWTISHTVAGVIIAMVLFGVTAYSFLFLAATFCYDCPYQSSQTILAWAAIKYLTYSDDTFVRSLRSLIACLPSVKSLGRLPGRIRSGVRSALESFRCVPAAPTEAEHIPLVVAETPTRIFEDISIDWEVCKTDVRCICWMLDSTTDPEVILSTVRFAVDMIWYPEIAGAVLPHTLADLFFDCLLDGQVIPGKSEHASSIGMALVSVLSVHLSIGRAARRKTKK